MDDLSVLPPVATELIDEYVGDMRAAILEYDENSILYQCLNVCKFDLGSEMTMRRRTKYLLIFRKWKQITYRAKWLRADPIVRIYNMQQPALGAIWALTTCLDQLHAMRRAERYFNQKLYYLSKDFIHYTDAYMLLGIDWVIARRRLSTGQLQKLVAASFVFNEDVPINPYQQFSVMRIPPVLFNSTLRI